MPEPKRPQDHRPKAEKADTSTDDYFTFIVDGTEHVMFHKTLDKITFGFIRANRRRDETDYVITALEELAGGDKATLGALDSMGRDDTRRVMEDFQRHLGASLGE